MSAVVTVGLAGRRHPGRSSGRLMDEETTSSVHDLIVVSDLHIGRGVNPDTRRYFPLETFFYDDDFRAFCGWLIKRATTRGRNFKLIINGDGFDFLRIHDTFAPDSTEPTKRFSSELTPKTAASLVTEILAGHPGFVAALADVLAAGHDVVFLPGNHDLELHWTEVQTVLRTAIVAALDDTVLSKEGIEASSSRLVFRPWFYHEAERIWIEHGCQYDPENAFRYPLRGRLADDPGFTPEGEVDLPLGNFFQRYLYNAFGSITFIVPTSRANGRYAKWLLLNEPRLLLRVVTSHIPFAIQVLRRLATAGKSREAEYKVAHEAALEELASTSGLQDQLKEIDALKHKDADAALAADAIVTGLTRLVVRGSLLLLFVTFVWVTAGLAIESMALGFGFKALLSVLLNVLVIAGALSFAVYYALRMPADQNPRPLKLAAEKIAGLAQVPLVLFGHTHEEVLFPLAKKPGEKPTAWYLNSGTWISVFTHDVLLPRERVQFSFVDVVGTEARLMHWSPMRDDASPVILLDESRRERRGIPPA